ncbi:MAG: hypothetical protein ABF665_16770 [Gluconacetobacter sp.]
MTKTQRAAIIALIATHTDYDTKTVRIQADGSISAKLDADKTSNGPHDDRLLVGHVSDFANGANPYTA